MNEQYHVELMFISFYIIYSNHSSILFISCVQVLLLKLTPVILLKLDIDLFCFVQVARLNLFKEGDRTLYTQQLLHCTVPRCWEEVERDSGYQSRKAAVLKFNKWVKSFNFITLENEVFQLFQIKSHLFDFQNNETYYFSLAWVVVT